MNTEYREVAQGSAHLHIGKNGVNPNVIEHMENLFKKQKLLKIKVMPDTANVQGMVKILTQIIEKIPIFVYDVRGFTAIISKRKLHDLKPKKKYLEIRNQSHSSASSNNSEHLMGDNKSSNNNLEINKEKNLSLKKRIPPEIQQSYKDAPYIDYDDEDELVKINRLSDDLYGKPPKPHTKKKFMN